MVSFKELNEQNDRITELTNILNHLLGDRSLCDSPVTCDLFYRYIDEVKNHLEITENSLYSQLLTHKERRITNTANRFLGGSKEIKRIFSQYLKKWCRMRTKSLVIKEYDRFIQETEEMFRMVLDRIQAETEHLYPLVREVTGDKKKVA